MKCQYCGNSEWEGIAKFCGECGNSLQAKPAPSVCVNGHMMDEQANSCTTCGFTRQAECPPVCENNHPMNTSQRFCSECGKGKMGKYAVTPLVEVATPMVESIGSLDVILKKLKALDINMDTDGLKQQTRHAFKALDRDVVECCRIHNYNTAVNLNAQKMAAERKHEEMETAAANMDAAAKVHNFAAAGEQQKIFHAYFEQLIDLLDPNKVAVQATPVGQDGYSLMLMDIQKSMQHFSDTQALSAAEIAKNGFQAFLNALTRNAEIETRIQEKMKVREYRECQKFQDMIDESNAYMDKFKGWLEGLKNGNITAHPVDASGGAGSGGSGSGLGEAAIQAGILARAAVPAPPTVTMGSCTHGCEHRTLFGTDINAVINQSLALSSSQDESFATQLGMDLETFKMLRALETQDIRPEDYDLLLSLDEHVPRKTLGAERLRLFPIETYKGRANDQLDDVEACGVCLLDFEIGDEIRTLLPCGHRFHKDCIDHWLEKAGTTCPVDNLDLRLEESL